MSEQPPQNPYQPHQPPGPGGPWGPPPPDHPQATLILILGILGVVLCQVIGPVAWVMGGRARREIEAARGTMGGHTLVTVGWALGIVGTVLLALSIIAGIAVLAIALIGIGTSATTY